MKNTLTKLIAHVCALASIALVVTAAGQASSLNQATTSEAASGLLQTNTSGLALWMPPAAVSPLPGTMPDVSAADRIEALGSRSVVGSRPAAHATRRAPGILTVAVLLVGVLPLAGIAVIAKPTERLRIR